MARPTKQGIDYFPLDVGFLEDIKVRKIMRSNGAQAVAILICLLGFAYRDNGYFLQWDGEMSFLVADIVGTSERAVEETVAKAVQVDFFNEDKWEAYSILTSAGMQSRYFKAINRRTAIDVCLDYLLVDLADFVDPNSVNVNKNSVNVSRSTQRKEEEIREKEIRVEEKKEEKTDSPLLPEKMTCIQYFQNTINPVMTSRELQILMKLRDMGADDEMIILAIDEAIENGARNIRYIAKIVGACLGEGCTTADQFKARQAQWEKSKGSRSSRKSKSMGNFDQREYDEEEITGLYRSLDFLKPKDGADHDG